MLSSISNLSDRGALHYLSQQILFLSMPTPRVPSRQHRRYQHINMAGNQDICYETLCLMRYPINPNRSAANPLYLSSIQTAEKAKRDGIRVNCAVAWAKLASSRSEYCRGFFLNSLFVSFRFENCRGRDPIVLHSSRILMISWAFLLVNCLPTYVPISAS